MRVTLTLTADINLNCESPETITEHMRICFNRAIGDGALTGDTAAEADTWEMDITAEA